MIKLMQKGFSVIIVLVGLIGILIVAAGLFYASRLTAPKVQPQNSTSVVQTSPLAVSNIQQTPAPTTTQVNETSGWKTYKSVIEGFTFKYPSDWQVREEPKTYYDGSKSVWDEAVTLLSNDEFNIELRVGNSIPSSRPGKCTDYEMTEINSNTHIKISRVITSYEVGGIYNSIGLADKNAGGRACSDPYFNSQVKNGRVVILHGFYASPVTGSKQDAYIKSLKTFDDSPSVQIAKKILGSLSY